MTQDFVSYGMMELLAGPAVPWRSLRGNADAGFGSERFHCGVEAKATEVSARPPRSVFHVHRNPPFRAELPQHTMPVAASGVTLPNTPVHLLVGRASPPPAVQRPCPV